MCAIRLDAEQELHVDTVCVSTRTVPFAVVSIQVGLGSPALMLIVPVGGFDVKMKHVLLQPVSEIPNKGNTSRSNFQTCPHRARLFLTSGSAMRHLRTGGSSRGSYSNTAGPAQLKCHRLARAAIRISLPSQYSTSPVSVNRALQRSRPFADGRKNN